MDPEFLMRLAIDKAHEGITQGQSPFGCAICLGDEVLAVSHNCVFASTDITAHAEITALRHACDKRGDILLQGATVACTCEPCPMCMAALHWARVETVYYGAKITDARSIGFNELQLSAESLLKTGGSEVKLVPELLREECLQLFAGWRQSPHYKTY